MVTDQEVDQRGPGEVVEYDCQARKLNKEDAIDRNRWRKFIKDKGCLMIRMGVSG